MKDKLLKEILCENKTILWISKLGFCVSVRRCCTELLRLLKSKSGSEFHHKLSGS